jgi:hypothetical protein
MTDENAPPDAPAPDAAAPSSSDDALSFDRADFGPASAAPPTCGVCKRPITGPYYAMPKLTVCPPCRDALNAQVAASRTPRALLRAAGPGALAALGGSVVWYAINRITGYELGLVAIAVGYVVGRVVRRGSRGIGGPRYQALAMALTYASITFSYVPYVLQALAHQAAAAEHRAGNEAAGAPAGGDGLTPSSAPSSAPATATATAPATTGGGDSQAPAPSSEHASAQTSQGQRGPVSFGSVLLLIGVVLGFALAAPFLGGAGNIMGIAMIGIALYEAWKLNVGVRLTFDGPIDPRAATAAPPRDDAGRAA